MLSTSNHIIYKESTGSENVFPLKPYQLVSLWNMIEFEASKITTMVHVLAAFQAILFQQSTKTPFVKFKNIDDEFYNVNILRKILDKGRDLTKDYGLSTSERFMGEISRTLEELDISVLFYNLKQLITLMRDELEEQKFLYISPKDVTWLNNALSFGIDVKESFPSASDDIKEAGNCYALGCPTSCVFHCMRILEHGLCALAKDVGLTFDVQQWHTIIEAIESKIKELRKLQKGPEKDERLQFLSEAAKEFMYFKEGWRNHVSHKRTIYDMPQALSVIEHVRSFMSHISKRVKE